MQGRRAARKRVSLLISQVDKNFYWYITTPPHWFPFSETGLSWAIRPQTGILVRILWAFLS